MYPTTTRASRPCKKAIHPNDRDKAATLHKQLLDCTSAEDARDLIVKIEELCLCKGNASHWEVLKGSSLREELHRRWLGELRLKVHTASPVKPETEVSEEEETLSKCLQHEVPPTTARKDPVVRDVRPSTIAARSAESTLKTEKELNTPEFEPHKQGSKIALADVLRRPLFSQSDKKSASSREQKKNQQLETGILYALAREGCERMLKIGLTTRTALDRSGEIARCGWVPQVKIEVENVPYLKRAELLVHYELYPHWRTERCKQCLHKHQEWFEVDETTARKSMTNFAQWLRVARPYGEDGRLNAKWQNLILKTNKEGVPITSQSHVDALYCDEDLKSATETETPVACQPKLESVEIPPKATASTTPGDALSTVSDPVVEAVVRQFLLSMQPQQRQQVIAKLNAANRPRVKNDYTWKSTSSVPALALPMS